MDTEKNFRFSIVVPLFNEEKNVEPLIEKIFDSVGAHPNFLEIVLVDDGSHDRTAALATKASDGDQRIRLFRHEANRGLGAAIRTGLSQARGDFALYTDADLPFDFSLIPQLFSLAEEGRVVAGCRLNRGEGLRRWLLTKSYNLFVRLFFGLSMTDVNFACKVFPPRFLREAECDSDGSFIDVEMLLEARRLELEIYELPLRYLPRERGLSTLSRPTVILYILTELFGYTSKNFSRRLGLRNRKTMQTPLELNASE